MIIKDVLLINKNNLAIMRGIIPKLMEVKVKSTINSIIQKIIEIIAINEKVRVLIFPLFRLFHDFSLYANRVLIAKKIIAKTSKVFIKMVKFIGIKGPYSDNAPKITPTIE
jgi:hypothetical protein